MKKYCFMAVFAIIIAILGACGMTASKSKIDGADIKLPPPEVEIKEGDFVYRLYSEKDVYENGDIAVLAELTYIGSDDSIEIYHAASPFYFPIEEKMRGIEVGYGMDEPLIETILYKDEPFRERYTFSGGYGENDEKEYIDFVKGIVKHGFPEGKYIVHGIAEFFTQNKNGVEQKHYSLKGDIGFSVMN